MLNNQQHDFLVCRRKNKTQQCSNRTLKKNICDRPAVSKKWCVLQPDIRQWQSSHSDQSRSITFHQFNQHQMKLYNDYDYECGYRNDTHCIMALRLIMAKWMITTRVIHANDNGYDIFQYNDKPSDTHRLVSFLVEAKPPLLPVRMDAPEPHCKRRLKPALSPPWLNRLLFEFVLP